MKIAQREQNNFELCFLSAHLERLLCKVVERFVDVGFDSSWWFISDFNARLKNSLGDDMSRCSGCRFCADKNSIVFVRTFGIMFQLLFQGRQPLTNQMNILK